jgi:phosphoglucan,water dikinase
MYDENGYFGFEDSQEGKVKAALSSNLHIVRLLKTQLPSFADQFMVSVPMTRIRDIAHRNDIPKDLKNDIKHRL